MDRKYNLWSFIVCLILLGLLFQALYASYNRIWQLAFLLGVAVNTIAREHIETTQSPDNRTTIDFYTLNGGAATSISVTGIVNGPLWFKKRIYYENRMHKVDVEWKNSHIIIINNHPLDLDKGETYSN